MTGKLGSNIKLNFKTSSKIDKKQVYLSNHIKLLSISKDITTITNQFYIKAYWNHSSEGIHRIIAFSLFCRYLIKIFLTNNLGIINPELIKEPFKTYENYLIQSTKKELSFYLREIVQEIKGIFNKFNLSNSETVNCNKFIFTMRSD